MKIQKISADIINFVFVCMNIWKRRKNMSQWRILYLCTHCLYMMYTSKVGSAGIGGGSRCAARNGNCKKINKIGLFFILDQSNNGWKGFTHHGWWSSPSIWFLSPCLNCLCKTYLWIMTRVLSSYWLSKIIEVHQILSLDFFLRDQYQ